MLIPNHPDDEHLSALASRDDDAISDAALTSHVSTCVRCTESVTELGALRASLAELPDVVPPRPLQLLPPVADAPVAAGGGWIRRLFAPALTAGAALAMVGLIGTASPALLGGAASGPPPNGDSLAAGEEAASSAAPGAGGEFGEADGQGVRDTAAPAAAAESPRTDDGGRTGLDNATPKPDEGATGYRPLDNNGTDDLDRQLPAERSPWPMVLFAGVALMVGAALLRWILVPRAG